MFKYLCVLVIPFYSLQKSDLFDRKQQCVQFQNSASTKPLLSRDMKPNNTTAIHVNIGWKGRLSRSAVNHSNSTCQHLWVHVCGRGQITFRSEHVTMPRERAGAAVWKYVTAGFMSFSLTSVLPVNWLNNTELVCTVSKYIWNDYNGK